MVALLLAAVVAHGADEGKTGVGAEKISLPDGPGSIEGLGSGFEPQLNSGTAAYRVDIKVPEGTAGLAPQIALAYNAGSGNGPFGLGWNWEPMNIRRRTAKGIPTYGDGDVFLLDGAELVPLSDGSWRRKIESDWSRAVREGDGWVVRQRDGTRHWLGTSASARTGKKAGGAFGATFAWYVEATEDVHGNRIEWSYATFEESPGRLYPSRIRWGAAGSEARHEVAFEWEAREDAFTSHLGGFAETTGRRCREIRVSSQGRIIRRYALGYGEGDGVDVGTGVPLAFSLLRRVTQYDGRVGAEASWLPPLRFGYEPFAPGLGGFGRCAGGPPYSLGSPDMALADIDGDALPDFFRTDPLTGGHEVWWNRGRSAFAEAEPFAAWPTGVTLDQEGVQLLDMDGDSRVDLVQKGGAGSGFFTWYPNAFAAEADGGGRAAWGGERDFGGPPPPFGFGDADVRSLDLDGDKRMDWMRMTPGGFMYWLNRGDRWEERGIYLFGEPETGGIAWADDVQFANADGTPNGNVVLADMNGDGLLDLVRKTVFGRSLEIDFWPNRGNGAWGTRTEMARDIDLGDVQEDNVRISDVNGDGISDVVAVAYDRLRYWVNLGNLSFSEALEVDGTPEFVAGRTVLRMADMNGNGTTDFVWENWSPAQGAWAVEWFDFAPGTKPNVLVETDNGLGVRTRLEHATTTELRIAAREAGRPWRTRLPFSSLAVTKIERLFGVDLDMEEGEDRETTELSYADGWYDAFEREFRGFAFAEQVARGDERHRGSVTRTAFHTGMPDGLDNNGDGKVDEFDETRGYEEEPLKGRPLWSETAVLEGPGTERRVPGEFAADGEVFSRTETDWRVRTLHDPEGGCTYRDAAGKEHPEWSVPASTRDGRTVSQVWAAETRTTMPEANAALRRRDSRAPERAPAVVLTESETDIFGNEIRKKEWGVVSGEGRALSRPDARGVDGSSQSSPADDGPDEAGPSQGDASDGEGRASSRPDARGVDGASRSSPADGGPDEAGPSQGDASDGEGRASSRPERKTSASTTPDDERFTVTDYAIDLDAWILGKPCRERVTDECGAFVSERRTYYDGEAFTGLPLGRLGGRGLPARVEEALNGGTVPPPLGEATAAVGDPRVAADAAIVTGRTAWDAWGNPVAERDGAWTEEGAGHERRFEWDAVFHTHVVKETVEVGDGKELSTLGEWDLGGDVLLKATDPAGQVTRCLYDSFWRPVGLVKPGDTAALPTVEWEYRLADPVRKLAYSYARDGRLATGRLATGESGLQRTTTRNREQSGKAGQLVSHAYSDGGGREFGTVSEGADAGRWIHAGSVRRTARGEVVRAFLPFENGVEDFRLPDGDASCVDSWRDEMGRETRILQPPESEDVPEARAESLAFHLPLETEEWDTEDTQPRSPNAATPATRRTDGLGRLVQLVRRLREGGTVREIPIRYAYDAGGRLVSVTDPMGNTRRHRHDGAGRRIFVHDPNAGTFERTFDGAGNLVETRDARGAVVRYAYDGANRVLAETRLESGMASGRAALRRGRAGRAIMDAPPTVRYHYDEPSAEFPAFTNTAGRLAWVEDDTGAEFTGYTPRGLVGERVKRIVHPGAGQALDFLSAWEYDAMDRPVARTYPDGDRVETVYDARGMVARIPGLLEAARYAPDGAPLRAENANGTVATWEFDPRRRVRRVRVAGAGETAGKTLCDFDYSYDRLSNVLGIGDARDEAPFAGASGDGPFRAGRSMGYDGLSRLVEFRLDEVGGGQDLFVKSADSASGGPGSVRVGGRDGARPSRGDVTAQGLETGGPGFVRADSMESDLTVSGTGLARGRDGARPSQSGRAVAGLALSMAYDDAGNLVRQTGGTADTDLGEMRYGGDAGGSGRGGRLPGDPPGPQALVATASGESMGYDDAGNLVRRGDMRFEWDARGRLAAAEDGTMRAEYRRDWSGRRVWKRVVPREGTESSVLYVDADFELCDGLPVKCARRGNVPVARFSDRVGTSGTARAWVPLRKGWNLVGVAGTPDDGTTVRDVFGAAAADGGVRVFDTVADDWRDAAPGDTVRADSVFMVDAPEAWMGVWKGMAPTDGGGVALAPGVHPVAFGRRVSAKALERAGADAVWTIAGAAPDGRAEWASRVAGVDGGTNALDDIPPSAAAFVKISRKARAAAGNLSPAGIRWIHADALGSTDCLTDRDGSLLGALAYWPNGETRASVGDVAGEWGFAGKELDSETGMHHFEARAMLSRFGAFASPDPLGMEFPDEWIGDALNLNLYAYAGRNPLAYTDSDGQSITLAGIAAVGWTITKLAAVGAVVGGTIGGATGYVNAKALGMEGEQLWKNVACDTGGGALIGALTTVTGGVGGSTLGTGLAIAGISGSGAFMTEAGHQYVNAEYGIAPDMGGMVVAGATATFSSFLFPGGASPKAMGASLPRGTQGAITKSLHMGTQISSKTLLNFAETEAVNATLNATSTSAIEKILDIPSAQ